MQHIRIGDDDVPCLTHLSARGGRRVAVVSKRLDVYIHRFNQLIQFGNLVCRKRFCRKEVKRPRIVVFENRVEHRQIITHRFAGCRRCNYAYILACCSQIKRFALMAI